MGKKPFENIELNDPDVLKALSKVGVFITDYTTGENLTSNIWSDLPESFDLDDENKDYLRHVHPDDREMVCDSIDGVFRGEVSEFNEIYRLRQNDGRYRWVLSVGQAIKKTEQGKPVLFVGADSDITKVKEIEDKLRESINEQKKRTEELITLREIISEIGSSLDTKETIRQILKQLKRVIPCETCSLQFLRENYLYVEGAEGFPDEEEIKKLKFRYPQKDNLSTRAIQEQKPFLAGNVPKEFPTFFQPDENKPILSWLGIPLVSRGVVSGIVALDAYSKNFFTSHHLELAEIIGDHLSIALENALLHEQAYRLAMEDSLTGLGSRHRMEMEGRIMFETAVRCKSPISFVMLDIDFFKKVNDNYGHDRGDCVLKKIASIINRQVRAVSLPARFGGEEFIIIMPDTKGKDALKAVERIRKEVEETSFENIKEAITVSGGIYSYTPAPGDVMNSCIINADKALYQAKSNGRNRSEIFRD